MRIRYLHLYIPFIWTLLTGCRTGAHEGPRSDHFDGERFFNPSQAEPKGFLDLLRWQILGHKKDWPESVPNTFVPQLPSQPRENEIVLTFVNHATFLLQIGGINILTDPVWSERVSPVSWAGPKRACQPGIRFEDLPPIHWVLISHNHYDHLDLSSLQRLAAVHKPRIIVPLGDRSWLEKEGVSGVEEVDWWQKLELGPDIDLHFTPSQHWSARGVFDRNKSLWGSFLVAWRGKGIYFAGDTGYGPHFNELKNRMPPVELALLPIGAYEPRWFMKDQHMNPADALQAHQDLAAKQSLGIHYGCWQLTDEGIDEPARDLKLAREQAGLAPETFAPADVGRTYRIAWPFDEK